MPTAVRHRPRRYPSDTREVAPRQIVDAIRYLVDNGAKWRSLHADFPPWRTVYGFFARWNRAGVVTFIRDQLRCHIRTSKGRCPFPVTLIVDSQSVKAASTVGRDSRGYDRSMAARDTSWSTPWACP